MHRAVGEDVNRLPLEVRVGLAPAPETRIDRAHDIQPHDPNNGPHQGRRGEYLDQAVARSRIPKPRQDEEIADALRRSQQQVPPSDRHRGEFPEHSSRPQPDIAQRTDRVVGHHESSVRNPHQRLQHRAQMTADFFGATLTVTAFDSEEKTDHGKEEG
jgi:hypothetical protein